MTNLRWLALGSFLAGAMVLVALSSCKAPHVADVAKPHATFALGAWAGDDPSIATGPSGDIHIFYEDLAAASTRRLWHAWKETNEGKWRREIVSVWPAPYEDWMSIGLFNTEADSVVATDGRVWAVWGVPAGPGVVDVWAYNKSSGGGWEAEVIVPGLEIPAGGIGLTSCADGAVVLVAAEGDGAVHISSLPAGGKDWEELEVARQLRFPHLVCQEGGALGLVGVASEEEFLIGHLAPGQAWEWEAVTAPLGERWQAYYLAPPVVSEDGVYHLAFANRNTLVHIWGSREVGWETKRHVFPLRKKGEYFSLGDPRLALLEDGNVVVFFHRGGPPGHGVYMAVLAAGGKMSSPAKIFGQAWDIDLAVDSAGDAHLAIHSLPSWWLKGHEELAYLRVPMAALEGLEPAN